MIKKKIVESGGHIDVAYGTFDRPGPKTTNEILPDLDPITPTAQVANQITLDRPPVDDEDYYPTCDRDLQLSLIELSKMIPSEKMKEFYKKIYKSAIDMSDKANKNGDKKMNNEAKKRIAKMIMEAIPASKNAKKQTQVFTDRSMSRLMGINPANLLTRAKTSLSALVSTVNDDKFLNKSRTDAGNIVQKHVDAICSNSEEEDLDPIRITNDILDELDFTDEDEDALPEDPSEREMTLGELAPIFDYSGASGVNNLIYMINYKLFVTSQTPKIEDTTNFFINEYINLLLQNDAIDNKEAEELRKSIKVKSKTDNRTVIEDLPSFRTFFSDLVIDPALKLFTEKNKDILKKQLQKMLDILGIKKFSESTILTLMNQLTGVTPMKFSEVEAKLEKEVKSGEMTEKEKQQLVQVLPRKMELLHDKLIDVIGQSFVPFMKAEYEKNKDKITKKISKLLGDVEEDSFSGFLNPNLSNPNHEMLKDKIKGGYTPPRDEEKEQKKASELSAKTAEKDRKKAELKLAKDAKNKEENDKKDAERAARLKLKSDKKQERMKNNPKYAAAEKAAKQVKAALAGGKAPKGPLRRRRTED